MHFTNIWNAEHGMKTRQINKVHQDICADDSLYGSEC